MVIWLLYGKTSRLSKHLSPALNRPLGRVSHRVDMSVCVLQIPKTQIVTKLKNFNCVKNKIKRIKWGQKSQTQIEPKPKNQILTKTPKTQIVKKKKIKLRLN